MIDQYEILMHSVSAIISGRWQLLSYCVIYFQLGIEEPTSLTLMSTSLPSTTEQNMQPTTSSETANHQQTTTSTTMTESQTTTSAESSQTTTLDEAFSFSTYSFATTRNYSFNDSPNQQDDVLRDQAADVNSMRNRRTVIATTVSIGGLILIIVILILTVVIVAVVVKYSQQNRLLNFKIKKNEHQHIGLGKLQSPSRVLRNALALSSRYLLFLNKPL